MKHIAILFIALISFAACEREKASTTPTRPAVITAKKPTATITPAPKPATPTEPKPADQDTATEDLPVFETTAKALEQSVVKALEAADDRIAALANQKIWKLTFENTFVELQNIIDDVVLVANRVGLLKETSQDSKIRDEAEIQEEVIETWFTDLEYREDLFNTIKSFRDRFPNFTASRSDLSIEDHRLYDKVWREYKRSGMDLPKEKRDEIKKLKNELVQLGISFDRNIRDIKGVVTFTKDELEGVEGLERFPQNKEGNYEIDVRTSGLYIVVSENAKKEETRKKLEMAMHQRTAKENAPVLESMIRIRDQLAKKLGKNSWADYVIEERMAKTEKTAKDFLLELRDKLEPKWQAELNEYKRLKTRDTGVQNPPINFWDWRYYRNQMKKESFQIDTEALRVFFEMSRVQKGVFDIYEEIFGVKIVEIKTPFYKWVDNLQLYRLDDSKTKSTLGYLYLDLYPREGKYNHFANFGFVSGKRLANGNYRKPIAALICNFPKATENKPSLLSHADVETFFHEFGHALHTILTKAKYSRFAGTRVPRDFVEAPSQMLEAWAWDKDVLNRFAADYRDPTKKIDVATIDLLKKAEIATAGTHYRRQIALALTDLSLHEAGETKNSATITADVFEKNFLRTPDGGNYSASWTHLNGYDATYYGYAWADSIGQDLLTVFKSSPKGLMDPEIGMKLRNEIYAQGWSRDIDVSIKSFLGRDRNLDAFYKSVGLNP